MSTSAVASPAAAEDTPSPVPVPQIEGPIAGIPPGDPESGDLAQTYPYFASTEKLAAYGYVEEEFFISGTADVYEGGETVSEHPYTTRILVRRPKHEFRSNGTALLEWQNVSAGHDLDALWAPSAEHIMRSGYTWVGVSAQDVGVSHLAEWSPTRYGGLDVTDDGAVLDDELSYDVFSQAAQAVRTGGTGVMGRLDIDNVLAIGASQSAGRMTVYYDRVLPLIEPVFDGYGFMVGSAPRSDRPEPVFQVLSETDAAWNPSPPEDTATFRLWEVAGTAHSGWAGRRAREDVEERDLGGQTEFDCTRPPFSRVPLQHVLNSSYDHLDAWTRTGTRPPGAGRLTRDDRGRIARDDDGLALGGIRLSQIEVPTALNTGANSPVGGSETDGFCVLFGTHVPYSDEKLAELYPARSDYIGSVKKIDRRNVRDGYLTRRDAAANVHDAVWSGIGG